LAGYKELIAVIYPNGFDLDWHEADYELREGHTQLQEKLYKGFIEGPFKWLLDMGFSNQLGDMSESVNFMGILAVSFVKSLSLSAETEFLREKTVVEPESAQIEYIFNSAPFMIGSEYITKQWIENIWHKLNEEFSTEIKDYKGSVSTYFASKSSMLQPVGRIFLHLVESKKEDFPFAFLATYSSELTREGKCKHLPLKNALLEYKDNNKELLKLLSTVNKAAQNSAFIAELIDTGEIFHPIGMTAKEAYTFLSEIPLYEEAGILCRIPNWWRSKSNSLKISISVGNDNPSRVGFESIVDFKAELSLGGEKISIDELKKLISQSEGLALIKGKWVEVDHEKLKETLKAYEKAQSLMGLDGMNMLEAMRFQLSASKLLNVDTQDCEIEITNGEWLEQTLAAMKRPDSIKPIGCGTNFKAILRDYQSKGVNWLNYMKSLGFGACLADDMGLGKTIQVIALLNHTRTLKKEKSLLVIPASLVGNWINEIDKFAPSLKYYVLHPSENKSCDEENFANLLDEYDIFITTYGMLIKYDWLKEVEWNTVILDEAQAVKNPGTRQTRAVKQLKAGFKLAMTGTPIENRLSDLWSLFDFINKGLLGSVKEFSDYTKKLGKSYEGYSRLKNVVSPFILRRLKTDKSVIADLPDKIEMKTYTKLTKKQYAFYSSLVDELKTKLESSREGIERKGLVLSSIMKLKQICNHPSQYLGQDAYPEDESGKYERLREICETIYEKRERVLIFTQFKEITEHLKNFLETVFHREGLVLHGGTPVAKRKEIVARFQGQEYVPFLVLSIKAGGVGLNLTSANHVIHFDRWWNPAVENQATDRAFRIGQKRNVVVHKFITRGTIEEKIDLMIEDKVKLQNEIISDSTESWITEMDNRQLMELFRLSI